MATYVFWPKVIPGDGAAYAHTTTTATTATRNTAQPPSQPNAVTRLSSSFFAALAGSDAAGKREQDGSSSRCEVQQQPPQPHRYSAATPQRRRDVRVYAASYGAHHLLACAIHGSVRTYDDDDDNDNDNDNGDGDVDDNKAAAAAAAAASDGVVTSSARYRSGDKVVYVYDTHHMQLVQTLCAHHTRVTCVRWHDVPASYLAHGVQLYSADEAGEVVLWDVAEAVMLHSIRVPNAQPVTLVQHCYATHTRRRTRCSSSSDYDDDDDDNNDKNSVVAPALLVMTDDCTSYLVDEHLTPASVRAVPALTSHLQPPASLSRARDHDNNDDDDDRDTVTAARTALRCCTSLLALPPRVAVSCGSRLCVAHVRTSSSSSDDDDDDDKATTATAAAANVRTRSHDDSVVVASPAYLDKVVTHNFARDDDDDNNHSNDDDDDDDDDTHCIVDMCFSTAHEDVLYVATAMTVYAYDCRLAMVLQDAVLRLPPPPRARARLRRLFASTASAVVVGVDDATHSDSDSDSESESECDNDIESESDSDSDSDSDRDDVCVPLLYTYSSDDCLTAWCCCNNNGNNNDNGNNDDDVVDDATVCTAVARVDVRGVRLTFLSVATVAQSSLLSSHCFAVVFTCGAVARWCYNAHTQEWCMTHYYAGAAAVRRAVCICSQSTTIAADAATTDAATEVATDAKTTTTTTASDAHAPPCLCYGLDSGEVVVVDALHNVVVRRTHFAYAAGTRIVQLCRHASADAVWVLSERRVDGGCQLQVSLLHVASGDVVRVLRRPQQSQLHAQLRVYTPTSASLRAAHVDATDTFLLLVFADGVFEVWNVVTGALLYIHSTPTPPRLTFTSATITTTTMSANSGSVRAVCDVAWAPASLRSCVTAAQGDAQLLAVVFADDNSNNNSGNSVASATVSVSLWAVHADGVVVDRDALQVPLCTATPPPPRQPQPLPLARRGVLICAAGDGLVLSCRNDAVVRVLRSVRGQLTHTHTLRDVPASDGVVTAWSAAPSSARQRSLRAHADTNDGSNSSDNSDDDHQTTSSLVAAVFARRTFAVWDVRTGERVGYSRTCAVRVLARALVWLSPHALAVLCADGGCTHILTPTMSHVNSSVYARTLRQPLQCLSFLLPSHRTHVENALLLRCVVGDDNDDDGDAATAAGVVAHAAYTPAYGGADVDVATHNNNNNNNDDDNKNDDNNMRTTAAALPRRGAFGCRVSHTRSLAEELRVYARTLVPPDVAAVCSSSSTTLRGDGVARAAYALACWQGQRDKAAFWADVLQTTRTPTTTTTTPPSRQCASAWCVYAVPDVYSTICAPVRCVRRNHATLQRLRARALCARHRRGAVRRHDDSVATAATDAARTHDAHATTTTTTTSSCGHAEDTDVQRRRYVAREMLKSGAMAHAARVLLDGAHVDSPSLDALVTLAIASASAATVTHSARRNRDDGGVEVTARHAGALLLVHGDINAAVEKYMLAHCVREACVALQSRGRWRDAALLSRLHTCSSDDDGDDSDTHCEHAQRAAAAAVVAARGVAQQCSAHERHLAAARVLHSLGLWHEALMYLSACAHFRDVAGQYALHLALQQQQQSQQSRMTASREATTGSHSGRSDASATDLSAMLVDVLSEYSSMLRDVGYTRGATALLQMTQRLAHGGTSPRSMRAQRSARLAEFLSTNALLQHIGLHPTTLIERRDAAVGVGVYVRDACDAATTLLVVPSRTACATSVLRRRGPVSRLHVRPRDRGDDDGSGSSGADAYDAAAVTALLSSSSRRAVDDCCCNSNSNDDDDSAVAAAWRELDEGVLTHLTGSDGDARGWAEWCWRVALERHRVYSPWWGWLQSLPTPDEYACERDGAVQQCVARFAAQGCRHVRSKSDDGNDSGGSGDVVAEAMRQHYATARQRIVHEALRAHAVLARCGNVMPSERNLLWAVDVLLTRGRCVPVCWPHTSAAAVVSSNNNNNNSNNNNNNSTTTATDGALDDGACAQAELAVVPFIDLVNGSDDDDKDSSASPPHARRRCANAELEVATRVCELPAWYVRDVCDDAARHGCRGEAVLARLLDDGAYCLCLTLQRDLSAAEEVVLAYPPSPPLCTGGGVLDAAHDARLARLLRYAY